MRPFISLFLLAFSLTSSPAQFDSVVVFNEIHYHPVDGDEASEFIELYNQNSVNVDLSGWTLEGAGDYVFEGGTTIEGRSFLVIAKDPSAVAGVDAEGPLPGALANGGEQLTLRNHNGRIMDQFDFRDSHPWPAGADGSGATLAKRDPLTSSASAGNWAASRDLGGTPGAANVFRDDNPIRFSEAPSVEADGFWVELHNVTTQNIDLSTFEIRTAGGEPIALSGELLGESYRQVSIEGPVTDGQRFFLIDASNQEFADAMIVRDRPVARAAFSNGILTNSATGRFLQPNQSTPGEANSVPLDDSIVINEIMYHYRPDYQDPDDPESVYRENDEEWIELTNRGTETVDLTGWRLRGGIEFDFEDDALLAPGAFLVVAEDAETLALKYPDITIIGDYRGTLRNGEDLVELRDALGNPVDQVHYLDETPWPAEADGGGSSLELRHPDMDNSVPEAWAASDESLKSEWHTYTYRATAQRPVYTANVRSFHELRMGFIQAGRCYVDNVRVVHDPDGAKKQLVRNGTFGSLFAPITSGNWRLVGNHGKSEAVKLAEEGSVLQIVAESSMNYLNNLCEATLTEEVETGEEYEVSFDAKWLGGSPQLRTEVYYNKFARKHILIMPDKHGTPGRQNTAYVENPGPTYRELTHEPAVPTASESIRVSVRVNDLDEIDSLALFYSVEEEDWQSVPMTLDGERYAGVIPAQAQNDVVQFYVEGTGKSGGVTHYPADGPESGAFVRVDSPSGLDPRQVMRLIVRPSDATGIHAPIDILSNLRRDCTVILNEEKIVYNCGVRLRGSMFSRSNGGDAGLNIKFPADKRFRGVQPTVIVRRRNPQEILVKHMANQSVGVPASYNDLVELRGYRSGQSGLARMEMARFGENYLRGAYPNGDVNPMFKMEGIRDFQSAGAGGVKNPMPIGWIVQFDFADLGDDKEQYRHVIRMISARKQDNYEPIIAMCKAFDAPDDQLREAVEAIIDTDQWCRMMAMQTLCGIADVYPIENPHNFNIYPRPTDGRIIAHPWDWDFTFNLGATSRIIDPRGSRKNLWRILEEPGINRLFRGHLLDLIDTVFNERYASEWFSHYGDVAGRSFSSSVSYVRSRGNSVRSQAASSKVFSITSNGGSAITVDTPEVTLQGVASVRVRTLEHLETGLVLEPHWVDDETWEVTLPLTGEENTITLQALDYQGTKGTLFSPTGKDAITVTNTSALAAPQPETLLLSEIMYHPAAPSEQEIAAGFEDQDLFEFIELVNVGTRPIDLTSLTFSNGVQFAFAGSAPLAPSTTALIVSNREAFERRYGTGKNILGVYTGSLANGGETLTLSGANERTIQDLRFNDRAPWPEAADGEGFSLTRVSLDGSLSPDDATQWRASIAAAGTPGEIEEALTFTFAQWQQEVFNEAQRADTTISGFTADPDGDGLANGLEHVLGQNPLQDQGNVITVEETAEGYAVTYPHRLGAPDLTLQQSTSLQMWSPMSGGFTTQRAPSDDMTEVITQTIAIQTESLYLRLAIGDFTP